MNITKANLKQFIAAAVMLVGVLAGGTHFTQLNRIEDAVREVCVDIEDALPAKYHERPLAIPLNITKTETPPDAHQSTQTQTR